MLQQGGVLGRVDVMRLEAAVAAAQRDAITATSDAASAEDALAVAIGLPEGTRVETVDNLPETPAPPALDAAGAVQAATRRRPELHAARARAEQAHSGASAELANLLPTLNAIGRVRETRAAYDSLAVARAGLSAAEEAFRIQEVRFREGATTTTELLSSETELAEARIGYATARHAYFLQLAALAQATGQLPDALLPGTGAP